MDRRSFLLAAAPAVLRGATLSPRERIDRALEGKDVDRPPFSFWHHFHLTDPVEHARVTLDFHSKFRTDLVKVMSDFPYPRPQGKWYETKPIANPFPQQIHALELIRNGLGGKKYFVETLFNPWNVAEKLSSPAQVKALQKSNPKALLAALDAITESECNHVRKAIQTGASGILLAVANAQSSTLSAEEFRQFSAPFDRRVLQAAAGARVNFLHLHVEPSHLDIFRDFPPSVINYSLHVSKIPLAEMRRHYPAWALAGGVDEVHYRNLTVGEIQKQIAAARAAAGAKFLVTPGCSVPDPSTDPELERLPKALGA